MEIAGKVCDLVQKYIQQGDSIASGKLYDSYDKSNLVDDGKSIYLESPQYAKNVEFGRKSGSKMPPKQSIEQWLTQKNIGSVKDRKEIAYFISKKIAKNGITPTKYLERAMENVMYDYQDEIKLAINKDCKEFIIQLEIEIGI